ncbi:MAG: tRNA pseudouridine(13) synthase TruD, partial [Planctomycetes bacterium]|nr:tRNA pseudouridine(13) synthase TruD [Planctomycetota bacterium]
PKGDRRFHVQSLQSALFDDWVARRMESPVGIGRAWAGDWVRDRTLGRTHQALEDRPLTPDESVLGPLFGKKMRAASGRALELEEAVLAGAGLERGAFEGLGPIAPKGGRRPLRVPVTGLEWSWEPDGLSLEFLLPSGSYATALLDQLGKDFQQAGEVAS